MSERTCSVDPCERRDLIGEWCGMHYQRHRRNGSMEPLRPGGRRGGPKVAPCKVDGCEALAGLPGTGRGWCASHYRRWKIYGDPLGAHQPTVGIAQCGINDCAEVVQARGWCTKHYTRWVRFGDPEARLRGEVVDGRRICPGCQNNQPVSDWSPGQSYCRDCCARRTRAYRIANPYVPVPGSPAQCDCCGQAFLANGRRWRYCSQECFKAYKHKANWKHYQARRARLKEAFVEHFDRREIFERDGWICQICLKPVDTTVQFPHPASPSLDHIIPIARGGKHARSNAQTACLGCNVRKGARLAN